MGNKGLKITVAILAVVFATCLTITIMYKDDMDYKKAKKKGTKDAYQIFVDKHPNSNHYTNAKTAIDSIEVVESQQRMVSKYNWAKKQGTIVSYQNFLTDYPNSEYAAEIKDLLNELDDKTYNSLLANYNSSTAASYLQYLPDGKHASEVRKMKLAHDEEDAYQSAIKDNTVSAYQNYLKLYPNGRHNNEVKRLLNDAKELEAYNKAKKSGTAKAYKDYLASYPQGKHKSEIRDLLDEIDAYDRYRDNSLSNGAQPYSSYYGYNRSCTSYGCSEICVKAPYSSDVLVLIKKNNSDGSVVRHGYVRAGNTVCFEVPDGRYQTFFYYGNGWYPNKKMKNGVRGGFLRNEVFSKDNPQYLDGQILTYELILQQNGNFQTKSSSESEMF